MITIQIPAFAGMTLFVVIKVKDLLCLLLQQEEDSLIKFRINSGIPLLIQGGANYSEPTNLFRNRGGPFIPLQSGLVVVVSALIDVLVITTRNKPRKDPETSSG